MSRNLIIVGHDQGIPAVNLGVSCRDNSVLVPFDHNDQGSGRQLQIPQQLVGKPVLSADGDLL